MNRRRTWHTSRVLGVRAILLRWMVCAVASCRAAAASQAAAPQQQPPPRTCLQQRLSSLVLGLQQGRQQDARQPRRQPDRQIAPLVAILQAQQELRVESSLREAASCCHMSARELAAPVRVLAPPVRCASGRPAGSQGAAQAPTSYSWKGTRMQSAQVTQTGLYRRKKRSVQRLAGLVACQGPIARAPLLVVTARIGSIAGASFNQ